MKLEYNYKILRKNKLLKKGMCTSSFKSGYETLYEMGLILKNINIDFEEIEE